MSYATPAELSTWLGSGSFTTEETERAQLILDAVTGLIDNYAGQPLGESTQTDTLDGTGPHPLMLPRYPVTAVTSVTVDGAALTEGDEYEWYPSGLLYRLAGSWPLERKSVTVDYTAGFGPISDDIKGLTLALASQAWSTSPGKKQESIGDYSYTLAGGTGGLQLSTFDRRVIDKYRIGWGLA